MGLPPRTDDDRLILEERSRLWLSVKTVDAKCQGKKLPPDAYTRRSNMQMAWFSTDQLNTLTSRMGDVTIAISSTATTITSVAMWSDARVAAGS